MLILPILFVAVACAYTLLAAVMIGRYRSAPVRITGSTPVSLLKPLHGAEPRLEENLESFLRLDHGGPVEMICGVQHPDDPAIATVERLKQRYPDAAVTLVLDPTRHGSNAKVSNLINMARMARHPLLILSDSDMAVPRDYLARIERALAEDRVGAVTCPYAGRADAGFWSRMAAGGVSYGFLPSVAVGEGIGLAHPCMGSTIAIHRETLNRIGGFEALADLLADDYAIGSKVRALGMKVKVAPLILDHGCSEADARAWWRQEVRWHATVRDIDLPGFLGSMLTHPLPIALILAPWGGLWPVLAALGSRWVLQLNVDRAVGRQTFPFWLLPLRDCLGFATFVGAFFARSVDWRGARFHMAEDGRMTAEPEIGR